MAISSHLSLALNLTVTLPGAGGVELANSRRKVHMATATLARVEFMESLGASAIELQIEWKDQLGEWNVLVPWTSGIQGSGDTQVVGLYAEVPKQAQSDGNVLVRALVRGNGLLTPVLRHVFLVLRE